MGLLDDIRDGALDDRNNLTEVLRRCFVLGHRMKYAPLKDWAHHEINGYASQEQVPSYRRLTAQLTANFSIPGWQLDSQPVNMNTFPRDIIEDVVTVPVMQDVATLQKWEAQPRITLVPRHNNLEAYVTRNIGPGQVCTLVWLELPPSDITGMLSQIRNLIVEFVLNIEDEIGEEALDDVPKQPQTFERVNNLFQTNVYGYASNVLAGPGQMVAPQITFNIEPGNFDSLREFFHRQGIADADIGEVKTLLQQDPNAETVEDEGSGIGGWISEQADKAAGTVGDASKDAVKESVRAGLIAGIKAYAPQAWGQLKAIADGLGGLT